MSIKSSIKKDQGFTIVELLVVIVVIGILAAITIVSYTGVTVRAKAAQAQANATSAQSVAEAYNADFGYYPRSQALFVSPGGTVVTKLPAGMYIAYTGGTLEKSLPIGNTYGQTTVSWEYCGAIAAPTAGNELGGRIGWWDFSATPAVLKYIYVGSGVSTGGQTPLTATCHTYVVPNA